VDDLRPWQNWDKGQVAQTIDAYWTSARNESAFRAALVADLLPRLAPGGILEVGCGSGLIYAALKATGILHERSYRGGDITPQMLAIARARYPGVEFVPLDIFDLSQVRSDNVLCVHVLQHLPGYHLALEELLNSTRKLLYVVSWFAEQDDTRLRTNDAQLGTRLPFYANVYGMAQFLAAVRAHERVRDVESHEFGALSHAVIVHMR
jgi:SAM-dependent methyltransferase